VLVSNQFGEQRLTVVRRNDLLCLPSARKLLER